MLNYTKQILVSYFSQAIPNLNWECIQEIEGGIDCIAEEIIANRIENRLAALEKGLEIKTKENKTLLTSLVDIAQAKVFFDEGQITLEELLKVIEEAECPF